MIQTAFTWALHWHLFDVGGMVVSTISILFLLRRHIGYWLVSPLANVLWMLQFLAQAHWLSAGLQGAYLLFAGYGLARWQMERRQRLIPRALEYVGIGLVVAIFASAVVAAFRDTHTPFLLRGLECAAVNVFLIANWLTARKQLACWYCWMLGNALYAVFLWQVQLYPFFASQFLFFGLSLWGLHTWRTQDEATSHGR